MTVVHEHIYLASSNSKLLEWWTNVMAPWFWQADIRSGCQEIPTNYGTSYMRCAIRQILFGKYIEKDEMDDTRDFYGDLKK
jgi:hypothetical protein